MRPQPDLRSMGSDLPDRSGPRSTGRGCRGRRWTELRFIDNDLKVPYSDQFSLGLRSQLTTCSTRKSVIRISKAVMALLIYWAIAVPMAAFSRNHPPLRIRRSAFAPPGFGSIIMGTNGLKTNADSAYLKLIKRYTPSSKWNVTGTYTFTLAEENRALDRRLRSIIPSLDDYPIARSSGVSKLATVLWAGRSTYRCSRSRPGLSPLHRRI